jgi:hypothetical protein
MASLEKLVHCRQPAIGDTFSCASIMIATPTSYFLGSQGFLEATKILADAKVTAGPLGHVAAQCLELALKAYLLSTGMTEQDFLPRSGGISHSISKAWALCVQKGLALDATMPLWAFQLDGGHDTPHMFRYARTNSGIVLPAPPKLLDGLRGVLATVGDAIGHVGGN